MSAVARRHRLFLVVSLALLIATVFAVSTAGLPRAALAQTDRFVAVDGDDSGDCSDQANPCETIEYAITQADAGDTINVEVGTYTEPGLVIEKDLTIQGAGAGSTIIQAHENPGAASARVLRIIAGDVTIEGVTIRHGNLSALQGGGGIFADVATSLTLIDSRISDNNAGAGGGIFNNAGTVTLIGSDITENSAEVFGGGIYTISELNLVNSAASENNAPSGGGIYLHQEVIGSRNGLAGLPPAIVTITDSEVSDNEAEADGGGIFNDGGTAILTGSTISDNTADDSGGGIFNAADSTLELSDSTVRGNQATRNYGGGIYNNGDATLNRVTVGGSAAEDANRTEYGAGIYNEADGSVLIVESTITGNFTTSLGGSGGGIFNHQGDVEIIRSTISLNQATVGGGLAGEAGNVTLANTTVSGNGAITGGGLHVFGAGEVSLVNVTVTANGATEGGGIRNAAANPAAVTLQNTIIAEQTKGADCEGVAPVSDGHNLDSDGTCGLTEDSDISEGDANLGPLADNGGPTLTHALLEGSEAIDAGDDAVCAAEPVVGVDQRGVPRPQREACDIGAFELGILRVWGDLDCDGNVVIGDALKTARYLLGLSVSQQEGCPEPGDEPLVDAAPRTWGDVDCDGGVAIGDALMIARWLLGLSVSQEEGCPEIGTEVEVAQAAT